MQLSPDCARVLGSLVEKALTTPQQYPLTLNALLAACNQTSNREPVVDYDETTVQTALHDLKDQHLVRFVLPSHGRSVVRYRHVLNEALGLDDRQCAILAMLLLRGPQTIGELRTRTERMAQFDSLDEVGHELELLGRERSRWLPTSGGGRARRRSAGPRRWWLSPPPLPRSRPRRPLPRPTSQRRAPPPRQGTTWTSSGPRSPSSGRRSSNCETASAADYSGVTYAPEIPRRRGTSSRS